MSKPGCKKKLTEAADADSTVVDLSAEFSDPASDAPIAKNEIVDED